jgi:hypothetical protein
MMELEDASYLTKKYDGGEKDLAVLGLSSLLKNPKTSEAASFLFSIQQFPPKPRNNMLCLLCFPLVRNASDMYAMHQGDLDVMVDIDNLSNPILTYLSRQCCADYVY